ncbi:hypothetical protein CROQUDRAFT_357155 [Cronartium quercuum f. sp. fusiforme G11]|uniref:Glutamate pyruvate transaminase n=1 Tax=Cronartium quercuum f. sp. fusiforme G11 TaxID=708437 RepID=A0A9P6N6F4_9BASI|nr:hypothetical protein CROQUDRAFT_357155 [Cronartium quercuum f. sp. fusiforme G11]
MSSPPQPLSIDNINPAVVEAQYAVRGEIALKAEELRAKLASDPKAKHELGFDSVINCNIGNPQQLGQKPITFARQVACLTEYPELMDKPEASALFPTDVIERAKLLLGAIGSVGAYSHSKGVPLIRQHVAEFLEERDGFPADPESVFLTAGASVGVSNILQLLISSPQDGVMIPIPQYPLYTAALALNKARPVEYYLSEAKDWEPDLESLETVLATATAAGTRTRAMVVISPGNPVGNVLSRPAMDAILSFCHRHNLVLLADEVYQTNLYERSTRPFVSFKHALLTHPDEALRTKLPLVNFHSISKGQVGECGRRGGYFEIVNFPGPVAEQVYKLASIQLCPPLAGQIGVDTLVRPPKPGQPSYATWKAEMEAIEASLASRASHLAKAFNKLPQLSCNEAQGALYLFPKLELPQKAVEAAKAAGKPVDAFYCLQLLLKTGICLIPGSGFGQAPGTMHFRTTFLAPGTDDYVARFERFHTNFLEEYKD